MTLIKELNDWIVNYQKGQLDFLKYCMNKREAYGVNEVLDFILSLKSKLKELAKKDIDMIYDELGNPKYDLDTKRIELFIKFYSDLMELVKE